MLGDAIAAELPYLRAQAESLMVDACIISSAGDPVWDEADGEWTTPDGSAVYTGKCRIQVPNVAEQNPTAGETEWTVQAVIVSLPVAESGAVRVGHSVVVTSATFDPRLDGKTFRVAAEHAKTHATARRLRCEEVTR
jgi:hypothetical protein